MINFKKTIQMLKNIKKHWIEYYTLIEVLNKYDFKNIKDYTQIYNERQGELPHRSHIGFENCNFEKGLTIINSSCTFAGNINVNNDFIHISYVKLSDLNKFVKRISKSPVIIDKSLTMKTPSLNEKLAITPITNNATLKCKNIK